MKKHTRRSCAGAAVFGGGIFLSVAASLALASQAAAVAPEDPPPAMALEGRTATSALESPRSATAPYLSAEAQKVVDYLVADWKKRFRSTSIPLAMENLGMEVDDAVRLEVLAHFREHTDLSNNLTYWGPNNYVFSDDEKRIAKYLIHMSEREQRPAAAAEATEALRIDLQDMRQRLGFMAAAGFLQESGDPLGFALAPGYKRWAGPLQHNFHTVKMVRRAHESMVGRAPGVPRAQSVSDPRVPRQAEGGLARTSQRIVKRAGARAARTRRAPVGGRRRTRTVRRALEPSATQSSRAIAYAQPRASILYTLRYMNDVGDSLEAI
ncbi:MAG: hypothetical protein ACE5HV_10965 [Acidobacteriota bacterium]